MVVNKIHISLEVFMGISKEAWKEISDILKKYKIPYTVHWEDSALRRRDCPNLTATDKHIQINLVIPDYFEEV